eukprot:5284227-Ditylum_brightwellii.AAC.1
MSWVGVRGGCGCKGLSGLCFEALEKGARATMQPRPWNKFFQGVNRDLSEPPAEVVWSLSKTTQQWLGVLSAWCDEKMVIG